MDSTSLHLFRLLDNCRRSFKNESALALALVVRPSTLQRWRAGHMPGAPYRLAIDRLHQRLYPGGDIDSEIVKKNRRALKQLPKRKKVRKRRGDRIYLSWSQKS